MSAVSTPAALRATFLAFQKQVVPIQQKKESFARYEIGKEKDGRFVLKKTPFLNSLGRSLSKSAAEAARQRLIDDVSAIATAWVGLQNVKLVEATSIKDALIALVTPKNQTNEKIKRCLLQIHTFYHSIVKNNILNELQNAIHTLNEGIVPVFECIEERGQALAPLMRSLEKQELRTFLLSPEFIALRNAYVKAVENRLKVPSKTATLQTLATSSFERAPLEIEMPDDTTALNRLSTRATELVAKWFAGLFSPSSPSLCSNAIFQTFGRQELSATQIGDRDWGTEVAFLELLENENIVSENQQFFQAIKTALIAEALSQEIKSKNPALSDTEASKMATDMLEASTIIHNPASMHPQTFNKNICLLYDRQAGVSFPIISFPSGAQPDRSTLFEIQTGKLAITRRVRYCLIPDTSCPENQIPFQCVSSLVKDLSAGNFSGSFAVEVT